MHLNFLVSSFVPRGWMASSVNNFMLVHWRCEFAKVAWRFDATRTKPPWIWLCLGGQRPPPSATQQPLWLSPFWEMAMVYLEVRFDSVPWNKVWAWVRTGSGSCRLVETQEDVVNQCIWSAWGFYNHTGVKVLVTAVIRLLERELASENSMPSIRGNCASSN